jgi:peptide/nickel transport system ATP-binding protein
MTESAQSSAGEPLLDVRGLSISAVTAGERKAITVATDLWVAKGETVGIVGESGSGKSMTAKAIVRLLPAGVSASGEVRFAGRDVMALSERAVREIRGSRISLLFQDPFTMLNPLLKCGMHIEEVLPRTPELRSRGQRMTEVQRRLAEVGITDEDVAHRLPFQLSGGMGQRVALAAALTRDPELLIADEPSTALDVTTQAEILRLLGRVQRERGMSMILITHDLRLAFSSCDRVYVLYAGSLLEVGGARDIEREPFHPYTLGLLLSEPPAAKRVPRLIAIRGSVPSADAVAGSCSFAPRCDWALESCRSARPALAENEPGRFTACIRQSEIRQEMQALRRRAFESGAVTTIAPSSNIVPLVRMTGVCKSFEGRRGRHVHALKEASIEIRPGESVGLVGESGSGKTTLGRCVVGLETPSAGGIEIDGIAAADYAALSPAQRAQVRHTVQMVFQDPYSTLNPRHSVRRCLLEALRMAGGNPPTDQQVVALLREVGLPGTYSERRPAALSGGERQRVAIARALAVRPKILVCDEPVSSLDVSVQAQILNLFKRLQEQLGLSYLFITHDLAVVRQMAERVYVLYLGEIVEHGATEDVMNRPQHPYTRRLIESIPHSAIAGAR